MPFLSNLHHMADYKAQRPALTSVFRWTLWGNHGPGWGCWDMCGLNQVSVSISSKDQPFLAFSWAVLCLHSTFSLSTMWVVQNLGSGPVTSTFIWVHCCVQATWALATSQPLWEYSVGQVNWGHSHNKIQWSQSWKMERLVPELLNPSPCFAVTFLCDSGQVTKPVGQAVSDLSPVKYEHPLSCSPHGFLWWLNWWRRWESLRKKKKYIQYKRNYFRNYGVSKQNGNKIMS